jgi:acyl carrier protein
MGRPVANTQLRVLDRHMQLMPAGMAGELYIGGVQVALGYENREELTAERFLADPFQAGNRLYRTGDLVRYREDGALEFLGRMDDQVKVRGYRIELGEVEAALRGHPAIRDAAVLARAAPGEPTRLVAIVVYAGSDVPMASEIRRFLREWLPDHMIPGLFIDVGDFPRLSSGKIDRKALSAVAEDRMSHGRTPQAPLTTDAERAVADAWSRLLQVADVGAEDNFFELGGDSLLAMQVVLAIEDAVGYRLDPRVMFFKNLRQIAVAVDEAVSASSTQGGKNPR